MKRFAALGAACMAAAWAFSPGPAAARSPGLYRSPIHQKKPPLVLSWGRYGAERSYGPHNGIDIAVPFRTPVFAARRGVVETARPFELLRDYGRGYGGLVIVKHADGSRTWYAHLDRVIVIEGQRVGTKTLLGMSGGKGNGRSGGPHLHFMITDRYGKPVDPSAELSGVYLTRK